MKNKCEKKKESMINGLIEFKSALINEMIAFRGYCFQNITTITESKGLIHFCWYLCVYMCVYVFVSFFVFSSIAIAYLCSILDIETCIILSEIN